MPTVTGLGGFHEVGRQAIFIDSGTESLLIDYGISIQNMAVPLPIPKMPGAVVLSHAHLDHSGHLPSLYLKGYPGAVYATDTTFALSDLLLRDSHKVQMLNGLRPHYDLIDVDTFGKAGRRVAFGDPFGLKGATVTLSDSGHVPGGGSVLAEIGGKRILYSGDIKFGRTELLDGAFTDFEGIDLLITEATYSYKNHPDRSMMRERLRSHVQEVIGNGGIVLIPSFAVGRAQEMICMLYDLGIPMYIDGMGAKATRIILDHKHSIRRPEKLEQAFAAAIKIKKHAERRQVTKKPCIIVTSAGMLQGGPAKLYMREIYNKPECSVVLNGFQMAGTPGKILLDTGRYVDDDIDVQAKLKVEFMDFSFHCGRDNLLKFIRKVNPGMVVPVHSEHVQEFSAELKGMGFASAPIRNGETIAV
ncbi:MAG: MBL fold metallo-hydrolase [Candidatus Aenigmarchaeota archaeon]|nr:MBL fold metallo-hydrolase [Candidatus Aenigmarchaeota archaeon]